MIKEDSTVGVYTMDHKAVSQSEFPLTFARSPLPFNSFPRNCEHAGPGIHNIRIRHFYICTVAQVMMTSMQWKPRRHRLVH